MERLTVDTISNPALAALYDERDKLLFDLNSRDSVEAERDRLRRHAEAFACWTESLKNTEQMISWSVLNETLRAYRADYHGEAMMPPLVLDSNDSGHVVVGGFIVWVVTSSDATTWFGGAGYPGCTFYMSPNVATSDEAYRLAWAALLDFVRPVAVAAGWVTP